MAAANVIKEAVTVVLELTEEEALYVYGALSLAEPDPYDRFGEGGEDPVHESLGDALRAAGVSVTLNYTKRP